MTPGEDHIARLISDRFSLRTPQRRSLDILAQLSALPLAATDGDEHGVSATIQAEFPLFTAFERDFPCFAFALATGVGKTRLMGAFIAYLHRARGNRNFLVLAPNLTIHEKLLTDFTPGSPKYVFRGIPDFAAHPPRIVDGLDWAIGGERPDAVTINILNISKIDAEMRGGRLPRFRSMQEELGTSPFEHLAGLPDLVLLMDEAHRYRGSAAMRAIDALRPALGLEVTATPFVEKGETTLRFRNIVFDYPLARAIEDGFVKEPHIVTREGFLTAGRRADEIEAIKLEDGVRLHEEAKAKLAAHAAETGERLVKPLMLVVARDTNHAGDLIATLRLPSFVEGRYADKVLQVDSSARDEETVRRLLDVESPDEPTEIVVHVNMLKEGWDVSNLYTIVPLRPSRPRVLIEQTVGRGCRLPFGKRTGVEALDRLGIVVHDRFEDVLNEARSPSSPLRIGTTILPAERPESRWRSVASHPLVLERLDANDPAGLRAGVAEAAAAFDAEAPVSPLAVYHAMLALADRLPSAAHATGTEAGTLVLRELEKRSPHSFGPGDLPFVAKVARLVADSTIDVPRITPPWHRRDPGGFSSFTLDLSRLQPEPPSDALWAASLRTGTGERIELQGMTAPTGPPENTIVDALEKLDGVAYADNADLLFGVAAKAVAHYRAFLGDEADRAIGLQHRAIAQTIHDQMLDHCWGEAMETVDRVVTHGFSALKSSHYSTRGEEAVDFRLPVADLAQLADTLFNGFGRCLYAAQKFHSDPERRLAIVLDRDALKWFRPARGQFSIAYRAGREEHTYVPDFVAETAGARLLIEVKAADQLEEASVLRKQAAAREWCRAANVHASEHGLKPWTLLTIPHDRVAENVGLDTLILRFGTQPV